ncbi:MAG: hypothetical protein JJU29_23565 [Verrucomicrobia bacterium]|nr:hypothetical protein [Verrucomicrobiota bacterium]MCH8510341.1 hypothetical protein [Kiritimatiellia bacterium]
MITSAFLIRMMDFDWSVREGRYPNAKSFSKLHGVSERTMSRTIEFMKDTLGAPLQYDATMHGYSYEDAAWLPAQLVVLLAFKAAKDEEDKGSYVPAKGSVYLEDRSSLERTYLSPAAEPSQRMVFVEPDDPDSGEESQSFATGNR